MASETAYDAEVGAAIVAIPGTRGTSIIVGVGTQTDMVQLGAGVIRELNDRGLLTLAALLAGIGTVPERTERHFRPDGVEVDAAGKPLGGGHL